MRQPDRKAARCAPCEGRRAALGGDAGRLPTLGRRERRTGASSPQSGKAPPPKSTRPQPQKAVRGAAKRSAYDLAVEAFGGRIAYTAYAAVLGEPRSFEQLPPYARRWWDAAVATRPSSGRELSAAYDRQSGDPGSWGDMHQRGRDAFDAAHAAVSGKAPKRRKSR